jgi:hypothetical protein
MDQALGSALRIVLDNDVRDPELLFTVIIDVYEGAGDGSDFDALRTGFTERAAQEGFGAVAEELVRHAEGNGGADFFRAVKETGTAALLDELRQAVPVDEVDESYDEAEWAAFLQEYGSTWDGQEDSWPGFVDYFLFYAEERRVRAPAKSFVEYAVDAADRVAFFADYGISVAGPLTAEPEPDPEAWQAFLVEFGPSWDGTEEAWESFTPYFLFYATERGVRAFAEAFLENAPATTAERIGYFADYGVTIAAPEVVAAESDDEVLESLADLFTEVDLTMAIGEMQESALAAAVEQVLAEVPGAAAMPPEQLGEILSTALTEVIVEAMAGESG